jgi:tRNA pseudouridine38-40 synthase
MPQRLKLTIAYDGGPFAGWQSQPGGNTIQDHLESALSTIAGEAVRVHGAGRTDAGVHALGQCAHVDVPSRKLAPERWIHAINAALPPTIRVLRARYVAPKFHARFSAVGKTYRYRICNAAVLPPLELGRAWHVPKELDDERLRAAAARFAGRHDFAGFAANRGKPEPDTVRTITNVRLTRSGGIIVLEFSGDGFLYKMVRLMVGTIVRCGLGKMSLGELDARLRGETGAARLPRFVAPAEGLILLRVRY